MWLFVGTIAVAFVVGFLLYSRGTLPMHPIWRQSPIGAQVKERAPQGGSLTVICGNGYHEESRLQCFPSDDFPPVEKRPAPCEQIHLCLPNCPVGYRQVSRMIDGFQQNPACVLLDSGEADKMGCMPIKLAVVYRPATPLVWHWRPEISEKCATALLKKPIAAQYKRVAQELHGEGLAHFLVVVGREGRVIDSEVMDFQYTAFPPAHTSQVQFSQTLPALAAAALKHLEFEPYVFHQEPSEFQSEITILFKLSKHLQ